MASIRVRVERLEARHGGTSLEALYRRMSDADLTALSELYARLNADRPGNEAARAEILAIERRYRRPQSAPAG